MTIAVGRLAQRRHSLRAYQLSPSLYHPHTLSIHPHRHLPPNKADRGGEMDGDPSPKPRAVHGRDGPAHV